MATREDIIKSMINLDGRGLEIGPSYNPLLPKAHGYKVETVDHADADTLRKKYAAFKEIDPNAFEHVDYVSDGRPLSDLIGKKSHYDYIVASHVIEHVTDIIGFVQDCSKLLKKDGVLALAVPDKRFCFDRFKSLSTIGQALQAHEDRRVRHPPGIIFDEAFYYARKDGNFVWLEASASELKLANGSAESHRRFIEVCSSNEYHDAHAWHFTPSSFRLMMKVLKELGMIDIGEVSLHTPGNHEFLVAMSQSSPASEVSREQLLSETEKELSAVSDFARLAAKQTDKIRELEQNLSLKDEELSSLKKLNSQISSSLAWKLMEKVHLVRTSRKIKYR